MDVCVDCRLIFLTRFLSTPFDTILAPSSTSILSDLLSKEVLVAWKLFALLGAGIFQMMDCTIWPSFAHHCVNWTYAGSASIFQIA